MTFNVGIDFMLIVIFILCYFWLFNEIHTDNLAGKALRCLEINSKTLTLEEINKCIDIILQSELETFILLQYHSEFIPADRLNECRQRVKSNVL